MDGSRKDAGSAVTATVVRQFVPSRIERQVLAQAFELVCGQRCKLERSACAGRNAMQTDRVGERGLAIDTHAAGRRAA